MTQTIRRPAQKIDPDWKKRLSQTLRECGLVPERFTGQVRLDMATGGVSSLTKEETIR